MLVYGKNVAKEFLKNPKNIQKVILQENFDDKEILSLLENNIFKVETLRKYEMDHLVDGLHQGIMLEIRDYQYKDLTELLESNFLVMLDHIEDPHNLGAIIRTCEAAGVSGVIIAKDRQAGVTPTVVKTSAGAIYHLPVCQVTNLNQTISTLKDHGFWIVGTALEDSTDYREIDYSGKIVLIIGNEGKGISRLVRSSCDFMAKIPMYGTTNSLNASVASGIMIYEVIRNRK